MVAALKKEGWAGVKQEPWLSLKIKGTIINGEWDDWWKREREWNIKVSKYQTSLPVAYSKKEAESSPLIEVTLYALREPDQVKPWVSVLRKLTEVKYY